MSSSEETVSVRSEAGFSILEVVISLVILLTVLVSVSSLMVTAFKVGANSRYRQAATEIATSTLDNEVQTGATALLAEVGDSALPTVTSAGQQYVMEMEVSPYFPGSTAACASPSSSTGAMLKVTVWATWTDATSGSNWWLSGSSSSTGLLVEDTTLLAVPPSAFNSSDGTILVAITNAAGNGVQGVVVTATSGSTTLTATTTESGCALFANLSVGSWTVTGSESGYIDGLDDWSTSTNSASPLSGTQSVLAGIVDNVSWTYDKEATVTPTYTVSGSGSWLPTGLSTMPLTFYTSYASLSGGSYVAASPALVFPYAVNTTAPIVPSYYVVPGSCGANSDPGTGTAYVNAQTDGQGVSLTSGSQASPVFPLTPVQIVVTHNGAAENDASVSAVAASSAGCGTGTLAMPTLGLGTTCVPGASCASEVAFRTRHGKHRRQDAILVSACTSNCPTNVTLSSSPSTPTTYGMPVTLTATVACNNGGSGCRGYPNGNPTGGTVTFTDGSTTLGTATVSAGVATFTTTSLIPLPLGSPTTVTAAYTTPTGEWTGTSTAGTESQTVTLSTTTTLTASQSSITQGSSVTFTATVAASSDGPATGTVAFTANGTAIASCSTVTLVSQVATCTTTTLAVGSDAIAAVYTPTSSTNFATSTGTLTETVSYPTGTPSIISGLPYGIWVLTATNPTTHVAGPSVTVTVTPSGISIGGTPVTGYITLTC